MRRVSKGAWLAIAVALIASALCVVTLTRLAMSPPVVRSLAPMRDDAYRKLAIASPEGVLVIESDRAYRVDRNLVRHELAWPMTLRVGAITSVAKDGDRVVA